MIKVIQTCGRLSKGTVDRRNALLREVELYPRRSSILAVCRSVLGGNVPLDRLSHRASRSATARAKITAQTHKMRWGGRPPKVRFAPIVLQNSR